MSDDTLAANTLADKAETQAGHTVIVEAQTQAGPTDLAWSKGDQSIEVTPYRPNPVVQHRKMLLLGLYGLVLASAAGLGGYVLVQNHHQATQVAAPWTGTTTTTGEPWTFTPDPPVTVTAPPSTTTITAVAPPVDDAPTARPAPSMTPSRTIGEQDATFLDLMKYEGVPVTNRTQVIANAHKVCGLLTGTPPWTLLAITDYLAATDRNYTWDQDNSFTASAVTAYCPGVPTTR